MKSATPNKPTSFHMPVSLVLSPFVFIIKACVCVCILFKELTLFQETFRGVLPDKI